MSRALLAYPKITEYSGTWMSELRGGATQLVNTNKLVRFYDGCTGLKTGTTDGAGSCLSASATRGGLSLIAVTLGSPTSAERFSAARGLLDYGFANYTRVELPPLEELAPVPVRGGVAPQVGVLSETPGYVIVRTADKDAVKQDVTLLPDVQAPVETGQLLGRVVVHIEGSKLCEYDLVAADAVDRMTAPRALSMLLRALVQL